MSLGVQVPRRSALGLTWCEDFTRGRLGVRKNGGTIVETPPDVVGLRGKWADLPGSVNAYIEYAYGMGAWDGITFGCWVRDHVGDFSYVFTDYHTGLATGSFRVVTDVGNDRFAVGAYLAGSMRAVNHDDPSYVIGEHMIVGRWESGTKLQLFVDGLYKTESGGGPWVGTVGGSPNVIRIGQSLNGAGIYHGKCSDPFVKGRAMSDQEIHDLYNGATFH